MKKIVTLSLILVLISVAASAQVSVRKHRPARNCTRNQITVGERAALRQDVLRYKMVQRRSQRDGIVTPVERRKIQRAKAETRRDAFRFRHNPRRRLI